MYNRIIKKPIAAQQSFFLFGPRGTGKTTWLKKYFPNAIYIDLLHSDTYQKLLAFPSRLEQMIAPGYREKVIIDEIQKIPALLNEVHRLIESNNTQFILTGSSARTLRRSGVNLLAGRALTYNMYPLTTKEIGKDFDILSSLKFGHLPQAITSKTPDQFLQSYIKTYLREEVLQEGLTRNIGDFSRFLEIASFSQGGTVNMNEIAKDANIDRQRVATYFNILEDLLLCYNIPVFSKKAKRRLITSKKFYFFDVGVYRTLRPTGILDSVEEIDGTACETLVMQEIQASLSYNYKANLYFWRTSNGTEVDFVIYGEKIFCAIEVKRSSIFRKSYLKGLKSFLKDYPQAKGYCLYMGKEKLYIDGITIMPLNEALINLNLLFGI